jgi:hypothetical protein
LKGFEALLVDAGLARTLAILFGFASGLALPKDFFDSMGAASMLTGASAALADCLRMDSCSLDSLAATAWPFGSVIALGLLIARV